MKECLECGSALADNEPYCENCGFDPGFDSGSWNHGSSRPVRYAPKGTDKKQDDSSDAAVGCIFLILVVFSIVFMLYVYFS